MSNRIVNAVVLAGALTLSATHASAQSIVEGEADYRQYCATCHGGDATGAGPMAGVLLVQPPDLTRLSARNNGVFPVVRVVSRIDGRDPLVSHGSDMPVYGQFFEQGPAVALKAQTGQPILTSQPIADLVAYLENVQVE